MLERRLEMRMLCADLVDLQWKDKAGKIRRAIANLEDISVSGACLQTERPIPLGSEARVTYPKGELVGKVKYCVFREIGYFIGVEFDEGVRWTERAYKPQHMLDPRRLLARSAATTSASGSSTRKPTT